MKKLLESMSRLENKKSMKSAEKDPTGPKFTGYWKGTDPHTPGNKMVGGGAEEYDESILKDLSKGPRAKTIEEELAEAYAQFNEEDLGVEPKRPARKGSRHHRGHEPHPRYKTVKTDEGYDTRDAYELEDPKHPDFKNNWEEYKAKHPDAKLADFISFLRSRKTKTNEAGNPAQQAAIAIAMKKAGKKPKNESAMSEKDIELQDYRSMSHKQFQTAYGMTKTEWINKNKALVIQNPKIKQALGLEEGRAEVDKWAQAMYDTVEEIHGWAVAEQFEEIYYARDLQQLTDLIADNGLNINAVKAIYRTLKKFGPNDDYSNEWEHLTGWLEEYLSGEGQISEGAEQDPIVAQVVKQMRPGLTNLDLSNEAFLYFAYELGKDRARGMWSDYLPAIRSAYEQGLNESADLKKQADKYTELAAKANKLGDDEKCKAFQKKVADIKKKMAKLNEGWESGPEEYEEPYDDADDAYDRQRQEKIDTEAEKEWAKLPKVSTYQCTGRGPNMESNQKFGPEFDTLEKALEYRAEIMKDPKTPHPEHIGINTLTRVVDKEQTDEGADTFNRAGYNPLRDKNDYDQRLNDLIELGKKPGMNKQMQDQIQQRILDLRTAAIAKGFIQAESRGHTIIANKLKDVERAKKFASGELKVPTPQERQAQLKQLEKQPKTAEDLQPMANPQAGQNPTANPVNQQAVNQALNTIKTSTGSMASPQDIEKGLTDLAQGTANPLQVKKMKDVVTPLAVAATSGDPMATQDIKSLAARSKQIQQKQKAQQQKT